MQTKAIVFDLDHTLFDRYATFEALKQEFYDVFKEYLSENVSPRDISEALKDGDKRFLYEGWDKVADHVINIGIFKKSISTDKFIELVFSCFSKKAIPHPFTLTVLDSLRKANFKVGLITNGRSALQRKKLSLLGLEDSFDEIIVSEEFGKRKPDISIFEEMAKRLSLPAESIFYVGDHPINDIDSATKAGYKTIWVKSNGTWVEGCLKPTFEVETIEELLNIFSVCNIKQED